MNKPISPDSLPLDYANNLLFELEKAFWDERGRGARFRLTKVGNAFFNQACLPNLSSSDIGSIQQTIKNILLEQGILKNVSFSTEDRLLRVRVEGCVHRPVEDRMISFGIEPFTCIPANLIVLAIEEKLDRPVELAEIKLEDGACQLLLVVFDHRPSLAPDSGS
jgi:hypothetical protein